MSSFDTEPFCPSTNTEPSRSGPASRVAKSVSCTTSRTFIPVGAAGSGANACARTSASKVGNFEVLRTFATSAGVTAFSAFPHEEKTNVSTSATAGSSSGCTGIRLL